MNCLSVLLHAGQEEKVGAAMKMGTVVTEEGLLYSPCSDRGCFLARSFVDDYCVCVNAR